MAKGQRAAFSPQRFVAAATLGLMLLPPLACTDPVTSADIGGVKLGGVCGQVSDCEAGLKCTNKVCAALSTGTPLPARGDVCNTNADCGTTLVCGTQGRCTKNAPVAAGGPCALPFDCVSGLVCNNSGQCATPSTAGTIDLDNQCLALTDCQRPYVCSPIGPDGPRCRKIPFSPGVDCSRTQQEAGDYRAYYEVPPLAVTSPMEFYRLPFPNDIRVRNGHVSLAGHFAPDPNASLGLDLGGTYFDAISEDATGFATDAPVFFQFSDKLDLRTICLDGNSTYPAIATTDKTVPTGSPAMSFCTANGPPTVYLVDITPTSPTYNQHIPVQLGYDRNAGQYICQNWLGIAPLDGFPLAPRTTYAAVVTTGVHDSVGDVPVQDVDFALMLAATPPNLAPRPEMDAAYAAMAPLRAWLQDTSIDPIDRVEPTALAAATVFTTADATQLAPKLHDAVYARSVPTFVHNGNDLADPNNAVVCGLGVQSPCDDHFTNILHQRGCGPANPNFLQIEGRYTGNTMWQEGPRPYSLATQGAMVVDANGTPQPQGTESMCFGLTVPTGQIEPAAGWPLIIYAHGTGGSYKSFMLDGTAAMLSPEGFAVISFDNVMHGWRQGSDPNRWFPDPSTLFFNLSNPRASRDNIFQGAADLMQLTRLVRSGAAVTTPSTGAIHFDPNNIFFVGHSQGTVIAPPFLATETHIKASVLAGAGAELALSVLDKRKPIDFSQVAGFFFGDRNLKRVHPMMGILNLFFAPSDAVNYAPLFVQAPLAGHAPLSILHIMGVGDSFAPDSTQRALVRAAQWPVVGTAPEPFSGSTNVATTPGTHGAAQFATDGSYDGHFVLFRNAAAQTAVRNFLRTARDNGHADIVVP